MVEKETKKKCCPCYPCCGRRRTQSNSSDGETQQRKADEFGEDQSLPYIGELRDLHVGQLVSVIGYVNYRCKRFSINFLCSQQENGDIAFHFNPRMEMRYVVRNCRLKGHWGDEETSAIANFDFAVGKRFTVEFLVTEHEFMVSINGRHWCAFSYRVPLNRITGLEVRGKVDVQEVTVKEITSYPVTPEPATLILVNHEKRKDRLMPFTGKLSKPLALGWALEICGRLNMLPQHFFINLQDTNQMWPHPTIPLHLNPRFCTAAGVDVFVRNAWLDGAWGPEERAPIFPFLAGADFIILIRREVDCFTVTVGEKLVALFKFRGSVDKINYVYISGDLIITNVTLREKKVDFQITKSHDDELQK